MHPIKAKLTCTTNNFIASGMEKKKDQQIAVRLAGSHLEALDELRRKEKDLPSRAEMIRRLIEKAKK